jgi:hypothetical protein
MYPNWDFWFENKLPGNPASDSEFIFRASSVSQTPRKPLGSALRAQDFLAQPRRRKVSGDTNSPQTATAEIPTRPKLNLNRVTRLGEYSPIEMFHLRVIL